MDWSQIWPVIGIAVGGSGFLTVALQEWNKYRSGRADEERQENLTLAQKAAHAEALRDYEAAYRRIISEYCSKLRRKLYELGVHDDQIDAWPAPPSKPKPPTKD